MYFKPYLGSYSQQKEPNRKKKPTINLLPGKTHHGLHASLVVTIPPIRSQTLFTKEEQLSNHSEDLQLENALVLDKQTAVKSSVREMSVETSYLSFVTEQNKQKNNRTDKEINLKKKEVELSLEENSLTYKVHFPQENLPKRNNFQTSGPVQPDTIRYQWTENSCGGRTHIKRLKYKKQCFNSESHEEKKIVTIDGKKVDPKLIASIMVIKHLGEAGSSRNLSRMDDEIMTQWMVNHPELYLSDQESVMLTKERSNINQSGNRHVDVVIPSAKLHSVKNHSTALFYENNRLDYAVNEIGKDDENRTHSVLSLTGLDSLMKTHGTGIPLLPRTANPSVWVSEPGHNSYEHVENKLPYGATAKEALFVKKRVGSRICNSRCSSAKSKASCEFQTTLKFNHFCGDDKYEIDDETLLKRQINAAVNIQKIFRGFMDRKYLKQIKTSQEEKTKKRASAIAYAERKYRQHIRRMNETFECRGPNIIKPEWEKEYKARTKQQELERNQKNKHFHRSQAKIQAKQREIFKSSHASNNIYEIFHNQEPTKTQMMFAAIQVQRMVRGWLVRKNMQKAREKALKRTLTFSGFVHNEYLTHCETILRRYGTQKPQVVLEFSALLDYIEKRNKYEVEFDRIAKLTGAFTFADTKRYFEACGLCPSKTELINAIEAVLKAKYITDFENHHFTKSEIVDITFQIYVPKGTKLEGTRKSTWMNPLVNGEEALTLLGKKGMKETNLEHCFEIVQKIMKERNMMNKRTITPELLPDNASRESFFHHIPREARSPCPPISPRLHSSPKSNTRNKAISRRSSPRHFSLSR